MYILYIYIYIERERERERRLESRTKQHTLNLCFSNSDMINCAMSDDTM
jgi:hypothetical protein